MELVGGLVSQLYNSVAFLTFQRSPYQSSETIYFDG